MHRRWKHRIHRWLGAAILVPGVLWGGVCEAQESASVAAGAADEATHLAVEPEKPEEGGGSWGRAMTQVLLIQAPGVGWYWAEIETNKGDWDYPLNLATLWRKLTGDGIRFDDNAADINAAHGVAGSVYYQIGRGNGLGVGSSMLLSLAASTIWETVVEYREVHSINDTVMSCVGGPALGEGMFRLGDLLLRGTPTRTHRWLGTVLALPTAVNLGREERARHRKVPHDRHGLPREVWYDLEAGGGIVTTAGGEDVPDGTGGVLHAASELVGVSSWRRGGGDGDWYGGAPYHRLELNLPVGTGGGDLLLASRTAWGARIWSGLEEQEGQLVGNRTLLGFATGFRYVDRGWEEPEDVLGVVELAGLTWRHHRLRRRVRTRLAMDLSLEYGQVTSLAYPAWLAGGGDPDSVRSILKKRLSYHGWGAGVDFRYEGRWRRLRLGARLQWDRLWSIDSLDRYPDFTGDGLHPGDTVAEGTAELAWITPWEPLEVVALVNRVERSGHTGEAHAELDATRYALQARFRWESDPPFPERIGRKEKQPRVAVDMGPWPGFENADPLRFASSPMSFEEGLGLDRGSWFLSFSAGYFNLWDGSWHTAVIHREFGLEGQPLEPWELRLLELRHPEDGIYRVDVEGWVARLYAARGVGHGLTVSVSAPWVTVGVPKWDAISRVAHEVLGLHVGDRDVIASGQTLFYIRNRNRDGEVERWDELDGSGPGDLRLALSGGVGRVVGGTGRWAISVEAPTGDDEGLAGSGGWDVGARYFQTWATKASEYRMGFGFTWLDPAGSLLGVKRSNTWHVATDWRHELRKGSQIFASLSYDTSPLSGYTDTAPGEPALAVTFGGRFRVGRKTRLSVALSENATSAGSTPDFVLRFRIERAP